MLPAARQRIPPQVKPAFTAIFTDIRKRGILMNEKVLNGKKNGMSVLLLVILAYIIGIAAIVCSGISLEQAPNAMNIAGLVDRKSVV